MSVTMNLNSFLNSLDLVQYPNFKSDRANFLDSLNHLNGNKLDVSDKAFVKFHP